MLEWWHWIVLGAVLFIADIALINTYYLIWFGVGAVVVGALLAASPETATWVQIAVFGAFSLASLFGWLYWLQPKFRARDRLLAKDELPGQSGVVVRFSNGRGALRLQKPVGGRDVWDFSGDGDIRCGDRLVVESVGADGVMKVSPPRERKE